MRYLMMSKNLKLHLDGAGHVSEDARVECWSDAEFAARKADRKSISGCVLTVDGAVVLWLCKKQSGVSLSTLEAEFISASQTGGELLGMKELLSELKLRVREPMPMCINNQAAIKQLDSEKSTSSAKHVDTRHKLICHHAQKGTLVPRFVRQGYASRHTDEVVAGTKNGGFKVHAQVGHHTTNTEEEC
uniref:Polyprotein n=1 Tax=Peronospora matthiolae TaxID=2874970 RepID=A0AAV1U5R2_9STRA